MATINENACLPRSNFGRILVAEMGAERLPTLGRRPARAIYCLSLLAGVLLRRIGRFRRDDGADAMVPSPEK